jgi:hypothetical protein
MKADVLSYKLRSTQKAFQNDQLPRYMQTPAKIIQEKGITTKLTDAQLKFDGVFPGIDQTNQALIVLKAVRAKADQIQELLNSKYSGDPTKAGTDNFTTAGKGADIFTSVKGLCDDMAKLLPANAPGTISQGEILLNGLKLAVTNVESKGGSGANLARDMDNTITIVNCNIRLQVVKKALDDSISEQETFLSNAVINMDAYASTIDGYVEQLEQFKFDQMDYGKEIAELNQKIADANDQYFQAMMVRAYQVNLSKQIQQRSIPVA